jgi:hypothetical protein
MRLRESFFPNLRQQATLRFVTWGNILGADILIIIVLFGEVW